MPILMKRNTERDPWFSVHEKCIDEGEIVALLYIVTDPMKTLSMLICIRSWRSVKIESHPLLKD